MQKFSLLATWMILLDEIGKYPLQLKQAKRTVSRTKQTFQDNIFGDFSGTMLNRILFAHRLEVAQIYGSI